MIKYTECLQVTRPPGIRRSLCRTRGQRGQALPLGAIGLLVGALTVIATLNLGQAVHEKIRLQNSADASAYSLAALEARAFNFIALTNRTQIVHYNTAMALQSYLSYTGFSLGVFGTLKDLLKDLDLAVQTGCAFPPPANAPYLAIRSFTQAAARIANTIFGILNKLYGYLHDLTKPAIEAMADFNKYAIWQMQLVRALQVNAHLVTGMQEFVQANDPAMTFTAKNNWFNVILNSVLNSVEFQATWDRGASLNPFIGDAIIYGWGDVANVKPNPDKKETKEAYAIMSELANASRSNENIYKRDGFCISSWIIASVFGQKMGQTKLVEKGKPSPEIEEIRKDPINYPIADSLASDDYLRIGAGYAFFGVAAVVLLPNGAMAMGDGILADKLPNASKNGYHYRYKDPGGSSGGAPAGITSIIPFPPPSGAIRRTFSRQGSGSDDHKWSGIAPFFKFRPKADPESDFNQPSTWAFLNKHHSSFQSGSGSGGRPWHYDFKVRFNQGSNSGLTSEGERIGGGDVTGEVKLDTTIGGERNSYLFEGLNVVSRGMAYYHRPGVWKEPPNMFNPFWRARLAPVGAKLMDIFQRLSDRVTGDGTSSQVVNTLIATVKNFVSDVFMRVVTSVMTH